MADVTRMMDTIDMISILQRPDSQTPSLDFEKHQGQKRIYFIDATGRQAISVQGCATALPFDMVFL
jgi:hypothetical protein